MEQTFFWHDYETSGTNPATDWPLQFAGVRTNEDLEIIAEYEPVDIFCKLPSDHLPHPVATLITKLTPQFVNKHGIIEAEFACRIHKEISHPNTCAVGYNNLRFDDEVTRNILYRNFYPIYEREYSNGNSRWDLIDLVRATFALRPDGIQWPIYQEGINNGKHCFKLEELAKANGFENKKAHNALADVYATIELAKLIRRIQPKIYNYYLQARDKNFIRNLLEQHKSLVHVSGMYGVDRKFTTIVSKLADHPQNKNEVIIIDLTKDIQPIIDLNIEEIKQILFTARKELPEDAPELGIRTIRLNHCPFVAATKVLLPENKTQLQIDDTIIEENLKKLAQHPELADKIKSIYQGGKLPISEDPEQNLYAGGFFKDINDKKIIATIPNGKPQELAKNPPNFNDQRLPKLLFRYLARNYPEYSSVYDQQKWQNYKQERLNSTLEKDKILGITDFLQAWQEQFEMVKDYPEKTKLLLELKNYVNIITDGKYNDAFDHIASVVTDVNLQD